MHLHDDRLTVSPTDLANFLACHHKTALDLRVVQGELRRPTWIDPLAEVLRQRGIDHEQRYLQALRAGGLEVVDLSAVPSDRRLASTHDALRSGADVIVQAALAGGEWIGYADVLKKVDVPSPVFGKWSYEVHDTKLSRETRGGTILQLCLYTDLLGALQGQTPEFFRVVTPVRSEAYRFAEFGGLYRQVKAQFLVFAARGLVHDTPPTYPDPVDHCGVCRWSSQCNARRRADDHLSFVAGLGRQQQAELEARGMRTLTALAGMASPLEFTPTRGSKQTLERLREQARVQLAQRESGLPVAEVLPVETGFGLTQLPEPRPGDLFLDLEGDPFGRPSTGTTSGEGSREYLFGIGRVAADGTFAYTARWAWTDGEEEAAFDAVMAEIMTALEGDPSIHVYHYAPYEPSAFKRLMGRYAIREADLDRLLRGRRFVDLYAVVRQALRAGVETYSIKSLEPNYAFVRDIDLDEAGDQRRLLEIAIETGDRAVITTEVLSAVEAYNRDDCRSLVELQRWLETLRAQQIGAGADVPRPPLEPDEPTEEVSARQQRINALRTRLMDGVPPEPSERTPDQQAHYLVAYLLDWHYREDKVVWWEYFRLLDLSDDELLDEESAVGGLEFVEQVELIRNKKTGKPTGSVVHRYRYPPQECELRVNNDLTLRDQSKFGTVVTIDRVARTIDVKRGKDGLDCHPTAAFTHERISPDAPAAALFRIGERVADEGVERGARAAADLLLRTTSAVSDPVAKVIGLNGTTLPIQGPPGAGKTWTGAKMICELVAAGKRVGVTATSHKVIRNLLDAVAQESGKRRLEVRLGHKVKEVHAGNTGINEFDDNVVAREALQSGAVDVLGGTAWLWSRPDFENIVSILFVDEAAQMSLANVVASSSAAPNLVLLGDPQQLEQPQKGSHPAGVDASALDHVLGGEKTMPRDRGVFLPVTWRLPPAICAFTSEVFYEGRLASQPDAARQRLTGAGPFDDAGLFIVDVAHDGCRNASDEEASTVVDLVARLLNGGVSWIDKGAQAHVLTPEDILVVAAYNAQVARVQERLAAAGGAAAGVPVGTVDRFQGQEAPVVIYSMATSRPEDAPRGMEFLYSLNRLNVATSRSRCVCIVVASPRLFEPECRTPRQMQLANGLARYREMARRIAVGEWAEV